MKDNLISLLMTKTAKYSPYIAFVLVLTTLVLSPFLNKIQFKLSLSDLLPENHSDVKELNELTDMVGGVGYVVGIIKANSEKETVKIAELTKAQIDKSSLVKTSFFEREDSFIADRLLYMKDTSDIDNLTSKLQGIVKQKKKKIFDLGLLDDDDSEKNDKKNDQ